MKSHATLLLGLVLLLPGLQATPPHPSVLKVRYKGELQTVVRVKHDDPYVTIDGKETLVRSDPVYALESAPRYSSNFVEAVHGGLGGKFQLRMLDSNVYDPSALHQGEIDLTTELRAWQPLKGGFAVVVIFSALNQAEIIVRELPDLPADQVVKFGFSVHALPKTTNPMYFIQIFDETGREVRTNDMSYAWQFYAARERAKLGEAVAKYRAKYPAADHAAVPFYTVMPVFHPGAELPAGEVTVTLTVGLDGTVSEVDAGMIGDDSARNSVVEALGGWLFLPRLKAGQPEFATVNVPLQF